MTTPDSMPSLFRTTEGSEAAPREAEVYRAAAALFAEQPDWVTFYREMLGVGGVVRQYYPTRESLAEFEATDCHGELLRMMARLRENPPIPADQQEPTAVITVRIPRSMHEALTEEAYQRKTTLNKLCISKLVQCVDRSMIPRKRYLETDKPRSRKRKKEA
ncbi:MAG: hypothetical protein JW809_06445 [Pirellulales bacterium]|nr:hypothetical protein [Pirellulales bacterium]